MNFDRLIKHYLVLSEGRAYLGTVPTDSTGTIVDIEKRIQFLIKDKPERKAIMKKKVVDPKDPLYKKQQLIRLEYASETNNVFLSIKKEVKNQKTKQLLIKKLLNAVRSIDRNPDLLSDRTKEEWRTGKYRNTPKNELPTEEPQDPFFYDIFKNIERERQKEKVFNTVKPIGSREVHDISNEPLYYFGMDGEPYLTRIPVKKDAEGKKTIASLEIFLHKNRWMKKMIGKDQIPAEYKRICEWVGIEPKKLIRKDGTVNTTYGFNIPAQGRDIDQLKRIVRSNVAERALKNKANTDPDLEAYLKDVHR
jgi:hypothetical protein